MFRAVLNLNEHLKRGDMVYCNSELARQMLCKMANRMLFLCILFWKYPYSCSMDCNLKKELYYLRIDSDISNKIIIVEEEMHVTSTSKLVQKFTIYLLFLSVRRVLVSEEHDLMVYFYIFVQSYNIHLSKFNIWFISVKINE